jgi:hypothetical protein
MLINAVQDQERSVEEFEQLLVGSSTSLQTLPLSNEASMRGAAVHVAAFAQAMRSLLVDTHTEQDIINTLQDLAVSSRPDSSIHALSLLPDAVVVASIAAVNEAGAYDQVLKLINARLEDVHNASGTSASYKGDDQARRIASAVPAPQQQALATEASSNGNRGDSSNSSNSGASGNSGCSSNSAYSGNSGYSSSSGYSDNSSAGGGSGSVLPAPINDATGITDDAAIAQVLQFDLVWMLAVIPLLLQQMIPVTVLVTLQLLLVMQHQWKELREVLQQHQCLVVVTVMIQVLLLVVVVLQWMWKTITR